jgi:hypothetical protein
MKSDGMPTYHLANVVDDHTMDITHVMRGEVSSNIFIRMCIYLPTNYNKLGMATINTETHHAIQHVELDTAHVYSSSITA